jgi:hypothetical protein
MTCAVRWALDTTVPPGPADRSSRDHGKGIQTNFFDWLIIHARGVLAILSLKDPQKTFSEDRIEIRNKTEAIFLDIPTLLLVHDIDEKESPKEAKKKVANKYKRRYKRLIAAIKTEKQIFFLRWQGECKPWAEEQIDSFFSHLDKIKEGNQHYFISVGLNGTSRHGQSPGLQKRLEEKYRYKFFNLHDYPQTKAEPTKSWRKDQYDWSKVFLWINENKI